MMNKQYYVYIMARKKNGVLYVGITDDLIGRVFEHKHDMVEGFTKKYQVHTLVYYEVANNPLSAITREKQLKKWKRLWKIRIIEEHNPNWNDIYDEICTS